MLPSSGCRYITEPQRLTWRLPASFFLQQDPATSLAPTDWTRKISAGRTKTWSAELVGGRQNGGPRLEGRQLKGSNARKLLPVLGGKFVPKEGNIRNGGDQDSLGDFRDPENFHLHRSWVFNTQFGPAGKTSIWQKRKIRYLLPTSEVQESLQEKAISKLNPS